MKSQPASAKRFTVKKTARPMKKSFSPVKSGGTSFANLIAELDEMKRTIQA